MATIIILDNTTPEDLWINPALFCDLNNFLEIPQIPNYLSSLLFNF